MKKVTFDPHQAFDRALSAYRAGRFTQAERLCQRAVAVKHDYFEALNLLAMSQISLGRKHLALTSADRALAVRPADPGALTNRGSALNQLGRPEEAMAAFDRAVAARPDHVKAQLSRAVTLHRLKRYDEAVASYDRMLAANPNNGDIWNNRGAALHRLQRFDEALASFDRAYTLRPDHPDILNNRGAALRALKRDEEALASYDRALALRPVHAEVHNNRGNILKDGKRYEEALASYDRAIAARANYPDALNNRGLTLNELRRYDEALVSFDKAIAIQPNNAEAINNRGIALIGLKRFDEALANFNRAIAARPDYPEAFNNCGIAFQQMNRTDEALANYDRAIAARPDYGNALDNRGGMLVQLKRIDEALASYERALAANPDDSYALSGVADCAARICDWDRRTPLSATIPSRIAASKEFIAPFVFLGYSDDPALQLRCAQNYIADKIPRLPTPLRGGPTWRHDRLRIAYLSADYRAHPTGYLLPDLLETHDRTRFEIVGISLGNDDDSFVRKRIVGAFDTFHDVRGMSDKQVAELMRAREIDIAVDVQGFTGVERPDILARRPAPIQAAYLAFPGTMGTRFIDYILADKIVAPFEHQPFYAEKIVHLPDCYMVSDRKHAIAPQAPTRREMGLPESGFVFCCFNTSWKITPALFDIWMELLHRIEGGVLWLVHDNESVKRNLRREAAQRGIEASRLVFANRVPADQHLARHQLADLFLDTLPYNAHSTANDALRMGLPLLTCIGSAFPARVAASQLQAVGTPELIVSDLDDYRALALKLARDPTLLAEIKAKLRSHRDTCPLFDTPRFTRGIEAAYRTMWEIWQREEAPRSFAVASSGNGAGPVSVEPSP